MWEECSDEQKEKFIAMEIWKDDIYDSWQAEISAEESKKSNKLSNKSSKRKNRRNRMDSDEDNEDDYVD